jgi:hypothetical protein
VLRFSDDLRVPAGDGIPDVLSEEIEPTLDVI